MYMYLQYSSTYIYIYIYTWYVYLLRQAWRSSRSASGSRGPASRSRCSQASRAMSCYPTLSTWSTLNDQIVLLYDIKPLVFLFLGCPSRGDLNIPVMTRCSQAVRTVSFPSCTWLYYHVSKLRFNTIARQRKWLFGCACTCLFVCLFRVKLRIEQPMQYRLLCHIM